MIKIAYSLFLSLLVVGFSIAQTNSYKPKDLIRAAKMKTAPENVDLFSPQNSRNVNIPKDVVHYELFEINTANLATILQGSKKELISLRIPTVNRNTIDLELTEVTIGGMDGYVTTLPNNELVKVQNGKHFRGIVRGNPQSLVAISMHNDEVMGFISEGKGTNLVIGKLESSKTHILYEDHDLKDNYGFACDTPDADVEYSTEELTKTDDSRALSDCVRIYFEVDYDIYQDKGSDVTATTNYINGLFNQVATLYANEQINVVMSPLKVWTQSSPYNSSTSSGMLNAFLANTADFDGDLAQLLSYKASGGIAYVNQLCGSNPDYRKSFSSIEGSYQTVPTYSWSVMVITHELGHLFGSNHTHACVWNGNNTAIDGCYNTEGSCADPGNPSGGGTIMSYCHLTSVGINLNLGFGPQPGNLIRNKVTNATCTQACSDDGGGNDGGGNDGGSSCTDTEATLTLVLDNYPAETSWTLKNSSGTTLYSGGSYTTSGATITVPFCLPDGCFDFQINDSYGDGICCNYGQGSYTITMNNNTVASGGQFGSSETKNFCTSNNPPDPTCNDGVQNGDETGIDCGGSCAPCATCNDGVQNGNETGIDCGGDCTACPTCDDGVQNGDETGIDCGGSCTPCVTCNDGVQNGNETGIDCGGSCTPCGSGGNTTLFTHYFENGWDGWTDGGSDCYRYYGTNSYQGNYSIRLRDNSGTASAMTSSTYNVSSYSGLELNFHFYPNSMETGEDFWVRYYDGSNWYTVATFTSGTSFNNDNFYVATVPILSSNYTMSPNAKFRIQCDASSNADRVYIDQVTVTGLSSSSLPNNEVKITQLSNSTNLLTDIEDTYIAPNPATNMINVNINVDTDQTVNMQLIDLLGRIIADQKVDIKQGSQLIPIDVSQYKNGSYLLRIIDNEGDQSVHKFVVLK